MREQNLQIIRDATIKAVPEIAEPCDCPNRDICDICDMTRVVLVRPIRLADILVALQDAGKADFVAIDRQGRFFYWGKHDEHKPYWPLRNDDLNKISDEGAAFLAELFKTKT